MEEFVPIDVPSIVAEYITNQPQRSGKSGRIWPSDLGIALGPKHAGCTLAFWLKCRNEPVRPKKPGERVMLDMGDRTHIYVAELLEKALEGTDWHVAYTEVPVQLEVGGEEIRGRIDIVLYHVDGHIHIIDVKSKRGAAFKFLPEAKPGDVLQVQAYMMAYGADTGSVLYVDREGQNFMREFDVPRDDARPYRAVELLQQIRDNDTPPPPVTLGITRKENKGPDSLYLSVPWQITWCDLQSCACKKALPCKRVPEGIIAKIYDGGVVKFHPADSAQAVKHLAFRLLEEQYPDEKFTLSEETM